MSMSWLSWGYPDFAKDQSVQAALEDAPARSPTPSSASSASGAASTASRASTASSPTRPASAGSTATCPAGRSASCDESLELVRDAHGARLGHPPRDGHAHLGHRHEDRPPLSRAERAVHGELGLDRRQVGRRAGRLHGLRPADPEERRACPAKGSPRPAGSATASLPRAGAGDARKPCRDVFKAEIPHYFRHLFTDERSVAPRVEYASGLDGPDPQCVVSIIGCTGDWFGGWDGLTPGTVDQFITADGKGGRLPEVIARGEPAIMVCHWPGIYFNGEEVGFNIFKEVVKRLHARYDNLIWMKLSEIARYWAAKELTRIRPARGPRRDPGAVRLPGLHDRGEGGNPGSVPELSAGDGRSRWRRSLALCS